MLFKQLKLTKAAIKDKTRKRILSRKNNECTPFISPNLRILSRKNNEPTPFILFLAMTVTRNDCETNTSDRPNVSLVHG
ncbi:hypothetical protein pdam_00013803 [Pocillopora damicornis]|uniref:Uncharacterized protein n=1 Tax=Pocillopora damicornis TaxID=46731 RepID=A0A3M6T7J9_POCDA|nr:hypothetical protein pdam_00013803 [Pocillopora damicornis]